MGGRLALVVGSQCHSLQELSFVKSYAEDLRTALNAAGWGPAGKTDGLLLNPLASEFRAIVKSAFGMANEAGASLLIAYIGHGVARGTHNFFLMATDSPADTPDSENSLHFTQFIQERLIDCPSLDGLIFVVDACEAKEGTEGAAARWTEIVAASGGRMELLVASGADSAYDGCFTRTLLRIFNVGLPHRGERLLCGDVHPEIYGACEKQQAQYLAYSGGNVTRGDPGLWLVPNIARSRDAVTGRPAAGLVDLLTAAVIESDSVCERLMALEDSGAARLRLVIGPAGSGKSTLLALLIRPRVVESTTVADNYIKAAVFLDKTSTLESMADEMAAQLTATVRGFVSASQEVIDASVASGESMSGQFELKVVRPLSRCRRTGIIHLIIDGLDHPEPGARDVILTALHRLTSNATAHEVGHIHVIAGARVGDGIDGRDELSHAHRIVVEPPAVTDVVADVGIPSPGLVTEALAHMIGGWLIARLLREISDGTGATTSYSDLNELITARIELACDRGINSVRILSLLAAAGVGPVLPIRLLKDALDELGTQTSLAQIRDMVVRFGVLISRANPGLDEESLGISHSKLLETIGDYCENHQVPITDAHNAIVRGYRRKSASSSAVESYWQLAAPRHYLGSSETDVGSRDSRHALGYLLSLEVDSRATDNRDRWASWLPAFVRSVGQLHPDTLRARAQLAHWRGVLGDLRGAATEYQAVAADRESLLGPRHRDTLLARASAARWRGESEIGYATAAAAELDSVYNDMREELGETDRDTLTTLNNLAHWRGQSGDPAAAAAAMEQFVRDWGVTHSADKVGLLIARSNLASWRAQASGDAYAAVSTLEDLLEASTQQLGATDPTTLGIRNNLADWRGEAGDAAGAVVEFERIARDRKETLGADHPDTLRARNNLAAWRARASDVPRAVAELDQLAKDQARVLGSGHPDTATTLGNLAYWRQKANN